MGELRRTTHRAIELQPPPEPRYLTQASVVRPMHELIRESIRYLPSRSTVLMRLCKTTTNRLSELHSSSGRADP